MLKSSDPLKPFPNRGFGGSRCLRSLPVFRSALDRVPTRCRPALFYETFYNLGSGSLVALFGLSLAALKADTIFSPTGTKEHLMFIAVMFGGSSLLSPLVGYVGKKVPMRLLIIYPNLIAACLLFGTGVFTSATFFALIVGLVFVVHVFPRVAEMNMFRILYPPTHRGFAVGWVKAVASVSGLVATVSGTLWFLWKPSLHFWVYWGVGLTLALSALSYARIPVRKKNEFEDSTAAPPHHAFVVGLRTFLSDRRFVLYQIGFWFAGFGNHMSHAYVAESLKEDVGASDWTVFWIVAVTPAVLMSCSAPFWGRFLDRVNPMSGRATFNILQCVAYGFHFYGGLSHQTWPFVLGAIVHSFSFGGAAINWLTGSMYFAKREHISLYNSIHVGLTGLRGMLAPITGVWIYGATLSLGPIQLPGLGYGPVLFAFSSALSLCGAIYMLWMSRWHPGSTESPGPSACQL
ncbi:MAG: hypothetical protein CMJ62_04015 [Planctomycetaceae bacterium]|nr:hypothetical protein [Planctomycetaceae bacterium]